MVRESVSTLLLLDVYRKEVDDLGESLNQNASELIQNLATLPLGIANVTGKVKRDGDSDRQEFVDMMSTSAGKRNFLVKFLNQYRFPIYNRLYGLNILLMYDILSEPSKADLAAILTELKQFNSLQERYSAPAYMPTMHSGLIKTLIYIAVNNGNYDKVKFASQTDSEKSDDLIQYAHGTMRREAHNELKQNVESHSMRRAYYESLHGLYYLYDDFNDRQLHACHAQKMLFSDFSQLLIAYHDDLVKYDSLNSEKSA